MTAPRALGALSLVLAALLSTPASAAPSGVTLPEPELALTPAPLPLAVARPLLEPPPALPSLRARSMDLGPPPLPGFASAFRKGFPAAPDPGGFPCGMAAVFGRASSLVRCGVARLHDGETERARQALEEALGAEPSAAEAALASFWLAELDFHESRDHAAASRYRAAIAASVGPDLAAHAAFALGWIALRQGDPDAAREALGRAPREVAPPLALLLRFLDGLARLLAGDTGAALSRWDEAPLGGLPERLRPEVSFWRGVALVRRWEPEPAIQAFEEALRGIDARHPLHADALAQRGWAQLMRGMPDRALADLTAAAAASPRRTLALRSHAPALVRAYVGLGRWADAHETVRRLAADRPDSPLVVPLLLHTAEEARRRQHLVEAVESYRRAGERAVAPDVRAYATYRIAEGLELLAEASGDPAWRQRAAQEYRRLRDEGGDEGLAQRAAYWLALAALREGRPVAALGEGEELLRAGAIPELRERALVLTAEAAARAGAPNRAVRLFREALAIDPEGPRAAELHLALGWALFEDGDVGVALEEWQHAARLGNGVAVAAHEAVAMAALARGYDPEALHALRELERLAPAHPDGHLLAVNRGIVLVRMGDDAAAVEQLRPLLSRSSRPDREAAVRRALGIALYRTGRYADAQEMFQEAAQYEPGEASNWLGAGLAAYRQNRASEADRALHRARLSPVQQIAATAAYTLALVRRDDAEEFRRRAGAFIAAYPTQPHSTPLIGKLVADALARGQGRYALEWSRWLAKEQPDSPTVEDVLAQLAAAEYPDPALAREVYGEVVSRVRSADARLRGRVGLARAAMAAGRGGEAREALDRFVAEAPAADVRLPWAYGQLVRLHKETGDRERLLAAIEAFLARFPEDAAVPAMQLERGEILLAERRWDAAEPALRAARDSGDAAAAARAHVRLAELLRTRGEHDAAIQEYLGAIYLYPATPAAALGLQGAAQSYLGLQRPDEARIVLQKLATHPGADASLARWARDELRRLPRGTPAAAESAPRPGAKTR